MEVEEVTSDDIEIVTDNKPDSDDQTVVEPEIATESGETSQQIEYKNEIDIGSLEPNETKVISYTGEIKKGESNTIKFSANVKDANGKQSKSNLWEDQINKFEISLDMQASVTEKYVKAGDKIDYIIKIQNNGQSATSGLTIEDKIPEQLSITKITLDGEEIEIGNSNNIVLPVIVNANTTRTLQIETLVNESLSRTEPEAITNVAVAKIDDETIATTEEISHIIEASNSESGTNSEITDNDIEENDIAKGKAMIEGTAWFDENTNGKKDQGEQLLSNIKVRLLNAETNNLVKDENGNVLEVTTNENGVYVLDKIGNGKYIAIFDYDTSKYALTKYKAEGVEETKNSDAMINELTIEGNTGKVASTDIIEINNNNLSDLNIGFIKLQNFDLQLDKYVSKILIQDSSGSTVKQYDNSKMAKAELDSKRVNGATVIIEYNITVTNNGEIDGYAKTIADYMPSDLKFSSELNKDWYQSGSTLYNSSLANDKIAAGESRTITLTLTKSMTEDNTGLIYNTAEIAEDYNELGIADSNSTPGNKKDGENDLSQANVILSIRTGGIVYATIAIVIVLILGAVAFVIIKKKRKI